MLVHSFMRNRRVFFIILMSFAMLTIMKRDISVNRIEDLTILNDIPPIRKWLIKWLKVFDRSDVIVRLFLRQTTVDIAENLQRDRRATLQKSCYANGQKPDFKQFLSQSKFAYPTHFYSDTFQFLYCETAKVGCTQWKKSILLMENITFDPKELRTVHENAYTGKTFLRATQDLKKTEMIYSTYYKVMSVREPFERLVSAYHDKIYKRIRLDIYLKKAQKMKRKYQSKRKFLLTESQTTFEDFVNFIVDQSAMNKTLNRHWTLYSYACQPCLYQYDFIAKLETIEKDSKYVKQQLHARSNNTNEVILFPEANDAVATTKTNKRKTLEMFSLVPYELRLKLYEVYRPDYEMFSYPPPEELLRPQIQLNDGILNAQLIN